MDVAPLPVAAVVRLHDGVARFMEVSSRMSAGRRVAAADVTTRQALAQRHPSLTRLRTLLTALSLGLNLGIDIFHVFTLRHGIPLEQT